MIIPAMHPMRSHPDTRFDMADFSGVPLLDSNRPIATDPEACGIGHSDTRPADRYATRLDPTWALRSNHDYAYGTSDPRLRPVVIG